MFRSISACSSPLAVDSMYCCGIIVTFLMVFCRMSFVFELLIGRSYIGWRGNEALLIRMWKPLPSRCVLKTLRGSPKEKSKEDNIC